MTGDIEKMLFAVRDSVRMRGIGDELEKLILETEQSAGLYKAEALTDDELDMVAGGIKTAGEDDIPTSFLPG